MVWPDHHVRLPSMCQSWQGLAKYRKWFLCSLMNMTFSSRDNDISIVYKEWATYMPLCQKQVSGLSNYIQQYYVECNYLATSTESHENNYRITSMTLFSHSGPTLMVGLLCIHLTERLTKHKIFGKYRRQNIVQQIWYNYQVTALHYVYLKRMSNHWQLLKYISDKIITKKLCKFYLHLLNNIVLCILPRTCVLSPL